MSDTLLYRVRKSWEDAKSQKGAFADLNNAKKVCDAAGSGYSVFNPDGEIVYSPAAANQIDTSAPDPKIIWDFFKEKGLNDFGIAGLMGNLFAESGLRPCNLQNTYEKSLNMTDAEYTLAVDNGSYDNFVQDKAGYGLAQWTFWTRKQNMLDFHKKANKSIGDLNTQLEFLVYELTTNYKNSVWKTLQTAKSVQQASNEVLLKFERPADTGEAVQKRRASYGQDYYNKYAQKLSEGFNNTIVPEKAPILNEGGNKMKYSDKNRPLVCMQTQSTCYKNTSKMTVKGILWHSTGANNPTLKRYVQPSDTAADRDQMLKLLGINTNKNDWNHISTQVGLNAWIGKLADGTVTTVQTMPWDYKPWGCGSGAKGSCNNGWIQFEICEDNLGSKDYFQKVYTEACELTAYLCKLYNINPKGTVTVNGVKIPTILCHADSHSLKFGSNHGDVYHWFNKYGKTMDNVRNDVAKLLDIKTEEKPSTGATTSTVMYRVRETWEDAKSQIGAYSILENAKDACDEAGNNYKVFDNNGKVVYPIGKVEKELKVGDEVKLVANAKYTSGKNIPDWVFNSKLYIRKITENAYTVSTLKVGAITGVVPKNAVVAWVEQTPEEKAFKKYLVQITADVLNVRTGPGTTYKVATTVKKSQIYTIVDERKGWGKLKSGAGWIALEYTKKLKELDD